ncbi:hypothetical protein SDC9_135838 [bioreactor metagenome]|uniref:Uncharacterized protein n=1 Tax=bioreactor metagenome TaxID=1076179 RepID=A0A645DGZ1_9ZZZZ
MITTNQENIIFDIVKSKCKNAVQIFKKISPFFAIKSEDDFTIGFCKKFIFSFELFPYFLMIVNFTIDSQYEFSVFAE